MKQVAGQLMKLVRNELEKNKKKLNKLHKTLLEAEKSETYQLYGELLTASMHLVKQGMKEVTVQNYYDDRGGTVTIPLDPRKTPAEDAQQYFKQFPQSEKRPDNGTRTDSRHGGGDPIPGKDSRPNRNRLAYRYRGNT